MQAKFWISCKLCGYVESEDKTASSHTVFYYDSSLFLCWLLSKMCMCSGSGWKEHK